MHIAFHNVRTRLSPRTLLTLGVAVLLIIVGLLALHTFTTEAGTSTGIETSASVASNQQAAGSPAAAGQEQSVCSGPCEASPMQSTTHDNFVMGCILALLAGLLLVAIPGFARHHIFDVHHRPSRLTDSRARALPRSLSVISLSISRT